MKLNIGVFGSGRGSNFKSVLDAIQGGTLKSEIKAVISNNSKAGILEIANQNNIPSFHLSSKHYPSDIELTGKILKVLDDCEVDFILLAGYMKKVDPKIISKFSNRIINIHPALIPSFCGEKMYGLNVHKAVLEKGCKISGVTVHVVDEEYDHGPIILQKSVEVYDNDTPESLSARVLESEHVTIVEAIKLFEEDKIIFDGRKAIRRK